MVATGSVREKVLLKCTPANNDLSQTSCAINQPIIWRPAVSNATEDIDTSAKEVQAGQSITHQ